MAKRVFFSFDYRDVADFRANAVRNHHALKGGGTEYLDASLWEEDKKKGEDAIKKVIDDGLNRTTVTAVLIGTYTFDREWVRYEIVRSLYRGNPMLGIHINSIRGKDRLTKLLGPNPFKYLAYRFSDDGRSIAMCEYRNNQWIMFKHLTGWSLKERCAEGWRGKWVSVSDGRRMYDWIANDGYNNFAAWIGD